MKSNWSQLSPLQLGRYAEYLVKMEFALHGFDIYGAEVDDKGIDLVVRREVGGEQKYYDVQVKSIRVLNYIVFPKHKFSLRPNLLAALVVFLPNDPPLFYLIPSMAWQQQDSLLRDRRYEDEGRKSKPERGLNLSVRNRPLLEKYSFEDQTLLL